METLVDCNITALKYIPVFSVHFRDAHKLVIDSVNDPDTVGTRGQSGLYNKSHRSPQGQKSDTRCVFTSLKKMEQSKI